ncbi:MAG TPA: hypothetical protein PLV31_04335 [Gammaproteobacteria bacterium]|nr:hypothetical protein [Gammaproteobacteria bacterium]HRA42897.1 hypothetical protein [Gammaproteobacteria bacterium]
MPKNKGKALYRIIRGLIFTSLILLCLALWHMLHSLDWSQQEESKLSNNQKNNSYYLISYADGPEVFFQNRNILAASAINRGFDFIYNFRREHLDHKFVQQNPILNEKFGAGFWLWKPYLILKTLRQVPDGSIVMYADSGALIRKPLTNYIHQGITQGKDIVLFAYDPRLYGYAGRCASGDAFAAMNCLNDSCRNSHHVWAGIIVIRNSIQSRAFIEQWLHLCEQPALLKGLNLLKTPHYPEFSHHQHDEGLLSVLAGREAEKINFVPMDKTFFDHISMHRRKTSEKSLIAFMSKEYIYAERKLWGLLNKIHNVLIAYKNTVFAPSLSINNSEKTGSNQ